MPDFPGLAHVALTVEDAEVSGPWYRRLSGAEPVLSVSATAALSTPVTVPA